MATIEQLTRKINSLSYHEIYNILEEFTSGTSEGVITKEQDKNEIKLTDEEIEVIKKSMALIITENQKYLDKISRTIESYNPNRNIDANITSVIITSIITIGNIANNIIKAKYPNKEKKDSQGNTIDLERGYSSIADAIKVLAKRLEKGYSQNE